MKIPSFFKPILWSYDIATLDSEKNKRTILTQTINYGDLQHWRWIARAYGKRTIRHGIADIPVTTFRPSALRLATLLFSLKSFHYAPRGTNTERKKSTSRPR